METKWVSRWIEIQTEQCEESGRTLYAAVEVGCLEVAGVHYTARRSLRGCFDVKEDAAQVAFEHARRQVLEVVDTQTEKRYEVVPCGILH